MRRGFIFAALLLAAAAGARSQPAPYDARPGGEPGADAPGLPPQANLPGDRPSDYLRRAQDALAAGRAGEAHQALEMAQTRLLDRSVPIGQTYRPSSNPTVGQISQALQALDARDRSGCMQLIQAAQATLGREDF